jgi:hypothetical protein
MFVRIRPLPSLDFSIPGVLVGFHSGSSGFGGVTFSPKGRWSGGFGSSVLRTASLLQESVNLSDEGFEFVHGRLTESYRAP